MTPNQPTLEQLEVLTADIFEAVFNEHSFQPHASALADMIGDTCLVSDYVAVIHLFKRLDDMVMAHAVEEKPKVTVVNIANLLEELRQRKLI